MLRFLADASGICALVSIFVYFFVELFLPRTKYGDVLLQVATASPVAHMALDALAVFHVPRGTLCTLWAGVWHYAPYPLGRSPVSTTLRSGRPRAIRSSTTSKASSCFARPASSGGRCPAPGAYGLRTGSIGRW